MILHFIQKLKDPVALFNAGVEPEIQHRSVFESERPGQLALEIEALFAEFVHHLAAGGVVAAENADVDRRIAQIHAGVDLRDGDQHTGSRDQSAFDRIGDLAFEQLVHTG